jgi:hypothetical protein
MDRLSLAVIVTALMLLVFSSALLVGRSQSPVALIERPEKEGRAATNIGQQDRADRCEDQVNRRHGGI